MILGTLDNSHRYEQLSERFGKAFAFLRRINGKEELGRHEIDGDNVYALVQRYSTRPMEKAKFEAHRKYIDVQYVHAGRESILYAPLAAMTKEIMAYDESKEAALFEYIPDATHLHMSPGHFVILYPEDAHGPAMVWEEIGEVSKVVVKVAVA